MQSIKLSKKQLKILKLLAEGKTERAVAVRMKLSINTIKYHKKVLYRKLKVNCMNTALVKALKMGLISLEELSVTN